MDYSKPKKRRESIAFDFLGVIARHNGEPFVSEKSYTTFEPNKEVVDAIKILKEDGYKIIIHSTISNELMEKYFEKHSIPFDEINNNSDFLTGNSGKPVAKVYVDDRALCYRGQSGEELIKQIKEFKPYWK